MQLHDGVCSDWFEVEQGLRQGRMLSPLLFNIFAGVLTIALQGIDEDPAILAELVHLKDPATSMGQEPAVDYGRRAVWGMMYADDAWIVSRSPQELAKMVEVIIEVCRAFAFPCRRRRQRPCVCLHRGRWCESRQLRNSTNRCNPSPT